MSFTKVSSSLRLCCLVLKPSGGRGISGFPLENDVEQVYKYIYKVYKSYI